MTIEKGGNTSWYWDDTSFKIVDRLGKIQNSPGGVLKDGLRALEDVQNLKDLKKEFDAGQATLGELLNEIEEL